MALGTSSAKQTLREQVIPILHKLQETQKKEFSIPNSAYKASKIILNETKIARKRKIKAKSHKYRCKNPEENITKQIQQ